MNATNQTKLVSISGDLMTRYVAGKKDVAVRVEGEFVEGQLAATVEAFRWNGLKGLEMSFPETTEPEVAGMSEKLRLDCRKGIFKDVYAKTPIGKVGVSWADGTKQNPSKGYSYHLCEATSVKQYPTEEEAKFACEAAVLRRAKEIVSMFESAEVLSSN